MKKTIVLIAIMLVILLWATACQNTEIISSTNDEDTTVSKLMLYVNQSFSLPASPGAANTPIPVPTPSFFGVLYPWDMAMGSTNPVYGCDVNSNVQLLGYGYSFLGAKDLRPSPSVDLVQNFISVFDQRASTINGANGRLVLPFIDTEWHELNIMRYRTATTAYLTPHWAQSSAIEQMAIDTRNLQSIYYGSIATLVLRIEVECIEVR